MSRTRINRDRSIADDEEDYRLNVEPLIGEGMVAERLYKLDITKDPFEDELIGWWIIPADFYDKLDAEAALARGNSSGTPSRDDDPGNCSCRGHVSSDEPTTGRR